MTTADDCLFCRMAAGALTVDKLVEDEDVIAIRDINPRAPTHLLIIPRRHIASARELTGEHGPLLGRMFQVASELMTDLQHSERGYRLTFNVGEDGGQTVYHLHLHVLAGRPMGPEG